MPAIEALYSSSAVTVAMGRQSAAGTPRTRNLYKIRATTPALALPSDLLDLGIEVGSGSDTDPGQIKSVFKPTLGIEAHLRPGVLMNGLLAADYMVLSEGEAPATPVTTTSSAANTTRHLRTMTLTSVTGLAVGDWIQVGALTVPGTPSIADKEEVHEIASIATNTITVVGAFLYTYPSGVAVAKVDKAKSVTHWAKKVTPDNSLAGGGDLWTLYMKWNNGTQNNEILIYDCHARTFNATFANGQIPGLSSMFHGLHVSRSTANISAVTVLNDPVGYVVQNTRGSFAFLTDTTNKPRNVAINLTRDGYDDQRLTAYELQGQVHVGHKLNMTADSAFVQAWYDKVIYGGVQGTADVVSDAIPQSPMLWTAQSPNVVGSSTNVYEFTVSAPDCQFAGYSPKIANNAPIDAAFESINVVPNPSTSAEAWYYKWVNSATTDLYSAS